MDEKFVQTFNVCHEVVHRDKWVNFGLCFGARKFDNGFFAVRYEKNVILFNNQAQIVDDHLQDVCVFKNGYFLRKKIDNDFWELISPLGAILFCAKQVAVYENELIAFKVDDKTWDIYHFDGMCLSKNYFASFKADKLAIYKKNDDQHFVFALINEHSISLHVKYQMYKADGNILKNIRHFYHLCNGWFVVASDKITVAHFEGNCVKIDASRGKCFDIYDSALHKVVENVEGFVLFQNGLYLLNWRGEWRLFSVVGEQLIDKIFDLRIWDEDMAEQVILLANSDSKQLILFRLLAEELLYFENEREKSLWAPDGRKIVINCSSNNVFLL